MTANDRDLPQPDEAGDALGIDELDHLMTFVQDLDSASATYEQLGFTLSPVSHITTMGISNRLVLLSPRTPGAANFIELMQVADSRLLPPPMRVVLSGEEGIKSMVLMTRDAYAAQAKLAKAGYPFAPPAHVRREWKIPGEASAWPEFDVLLPIPAPLAFNVCQYHNVGLYLRRDWLEHPKSAQHLLAAIGVAANPSQAVIYFEKMFGARANKGSDGGYSVSPGQTSLVLYTPTDFRAHFGVRPPAVDGSAPVYAGARIAVGSLETLRSVLQAGQVRCIDTQDKIVVPAVCGYLLEFVELAS